MGLRLRWTVPRGQFSLDAFPFQDTTKPKLSISFPMEQRLFGQGAAATWSDFKVVTTTNDACGMERLNHNIVLWMLLTSAYYTVL